MKRILVVAYSKMGGFGGGIFATRAVVNSLSELYEDVTMMFPSDDGAPDPEIRPAVRQLPVADPVSGKVGKVWRILRRGVLHRFEQAFRALLMRESFDCVVFHNSKACGGILDLAKKDGCKVVTIHNNYEYDYTRDNSSWWIRPLMLPPTVRCERESVQKSDLNLVLSETDRDLLRSHYDPSGVRRIEVLGVYEYHPLPPFAGGNTNDNVFLITGNLSAMQTVMSLRPWMKVYYPVLRSVVPDSRLIVAGKHPDESLKRIFNEACVEVIDTPPDMNAVLDLGRYYICPTSKGGGVKLRVMDGLRNGLPVLAHAISARGYEPFWNRSLFVYSDVPSFREALGRMLSADIDRARVRALYEDEFSFEAGTKRLCELMEIIDN